MKLTAWAAALVFSISTMVMGQTFSSMPGQGRSMVVTKFGIVAAPQFLASQAGAHILEEGGNAIDAAIAANAVMGVVQPYVNGMGGDLFALYYEAKTGKLYGLNSSGWTPKALTIDYLKSHHIDQYQSHRRRDHRYSGMRGGVGSAAETGSARCLSAELWRRPFTTRRTDFRWRSAMRVTGSRKRLMQQPGYKETYLPNGVAPKVGDEFKNPALANSLRQVAAHGRDAFYNGPMTDDDGEVSAGTGRNAHARRLLGIFSRSGSKPISTTYRGWTVYELPPNGQGIAALSMLNIMEQFPHGAVWA